MPSSAAASSSGVFPLPALAGRAGSEPGTRSSGSDHVPDQNPNGTPPSDRPTAVRSVLAVAAVWSLLTGPAIDSAVPGATDRSWRIASGSPWPTNTASAAPIAAATSVVSPAAASTTRCAVMRRVDRVPRGWITVARISCRNRQRQPYGHNTSIGRHPVTFRGLVVPARSKSADLALTCSAPGGRAPTLTSALRQLAKPGDPVVVPCLPGRA